MAKEIHAKNEVTVNQAMEILQFAKDAYDAAKKAYDVRVFMLISCIFLYITLIILHSITEIEFFSAIFFSDSEINFSSSQNSTTFCLN